MFSINSTLVIQLINFGIAYTIIRRFLFVPTYNVIQEEDLKTKEILDAIDTLVEEIETIEETMHEDWRACQQYCQSQAPQPMTRSIAIKPVPQTDLSLEDVDQTTFNSDIQKVTKKILDTVNHV